jgi:hypothetical protein
MNARVLPPPRRVVTGHGADGRSCVLQDGPSPAMITLPERSGYRNANIWRTVGSPAPIEAADSVTEHRGVLPPTGGTVLRVIDIPPALADRAEQKRIATKTMLSLYPDAVHDPTNTQAGMHVTRTIDYAIVLSGTITSILENDETELHAGDILIQRGTNHAWENRTKEIVRIAFVLIDGN